MKAKLEIACFNLESALLAIQAGVNRIEYSNDYQSGGVTPRLEELKSLVNISPIPIHVLVRNRPGNFVYTVVDLQEMQSSIQQMCAMGVNGFVFGCLTEAGEIDAAANTLLLEAAQGLPCYFHRAFDGIQNWQVGVKQLQDLGFKGLLTAQRISLKASHDFELICGGGVRSTNAQDLLAQTHAPYLHSSAITAEGEMADAQELFQLMQVLNT